jgi:hypothetical protein
MPIFIQLFTQNKHSFPAVPMHYTYLSDNKILIILLKYHLILITQTTGKPEISI